MEPDMLSPQVKAKQPKVYLEDLAWIVVHNLKGEKVKQVISKIY